MKVFMPLKRLFRRIKKDREWKKSRKLSDHRAKSLAVKLVLSGALQPPRFTSWWRS